MVKQSFHISFDFLLERSIRIRLLADVELHNLDPYYVIQNFRTTHADGGTVLPMLKIKRKEQRWVHLDTERESLLSEAVGRAIDLLESNFSPD